MATIKSVNRLAADLESKGSKVRYRVAGRKGVDFFSFQKIEMIQKATDLSSAPDYDRITSYNVCYTKLLRYGLNGQMIFILMIKK